MASEEINQTFSAPIDCRGQRVKRARLNNDGLSGRHYLTNWFSVAFCIIADL
jgi:hypothetical protein